MVRDVVLLSRLEQTRWEDLGAQGRWQELADAVDDWIEREERIAHLTDAGAGEPGDAPGGTPASAAPVEAARTAEPRP